MESVSACNYWSGRQDSNLRPPAPKAGALTRLRYAPNRCEMKKPDYKNRALESLALVSKHTTKPILHYLEGGH